MVKDLLTSASLKRLQWLKTKWVSERVIVSNIVQFGSMINEGRGFQLKWKYSRNELMISSSQMLRGVDTRKRITLLEKPWTGPYFFSCYHFDFIVVHLTEPGTLSSSNTFKKGAISTTKSTKLLVLQRKSRQQGFSHLWMWCWSINLTVAAVTFAWFKRPVFWTFPTLAPRCFEIKCI